MEKQKIDTAISLLQSLDYTDKKDVYGKVFSLGTLNGISSINDKLILISILSLLYLKMREKNPEVTPLRILMQIMKQPKDNSAMYLMLEGLSVVVEDMCYGCTTADACGLKTSQEITSKIKEILDTWLPF